MATTVENFVGVTVPAGATSHRAKKAATVIIPGGDKDFGTEGSQANIDAIEADDASYWEIDGGIGGYPVLETRWYCPFAGATIGDITFAAKCFVPGPGEPAASGFATYILNGASWEKLDQSAGNLNADATVTGTVNGAGYRDANNYIWTRVVNLMPEAEQSSVLHTNYVSLTVETTVADCSLLQGHFRFAKDDWHPDDSDAATWWAAEDVGRVDVPKYERFNLVVGLYGGGAGASNIVPRLEWRLADGEWAEIKRDGTGAAWQLSPSKRFVDGDYSTTYLSDEGYDARTPQWLRFKSTGATAALDETHWVQVAWAIHASSAATDGATYEFRVTDAGVALDSYLETPTVVLLDPTTIAEHTSLLAPRDISVKQRVTKKRIEWPHRSGTVDSGSLSTITDAELIDYPADYWIGARLAITDVPGDIAPQGESSVVADFDDANNRLTFGNLTSTPTAGDQYWVRFSMPYKFPIPRYDVDTADVDMASAGIVSGWGISASDLFGAAELELKIANDATGSRSSYFQQRDVVTVEERYKSSAGTSTWIKKGTFLVWEAGDNWPTITVKASDPISLLTRNSYIGNLQGDKIAVAKKAFTRIDADADAYVFVDGADIDNHTVNWCTTPAPRAWHTTKTTPVTEKSDGMQILFGQGEIRIAKDYYENELGNPTTIDVEYSRWALDTDRTLNLVVKNVDSATTLTLTTDPLTASAHKGQHVCFQTGCGRFKQFAIADNATDTITFVEGTDLIAECIQGSDDAVEGDKLTVIVPSMPEYYLMEVLLDGGFQAGDPCGLFYVSEVEALSTAIIMPPNVANRGAFQYEDETTHWEVVESMRPFMPANYLVYCDPDGNLHAKVSTQSSSPDYTLAHVSPKAVRTKMGTNAYTHIRYRGRDKNPVNAALPIHGATITSLDPTCNVPDDADTMDDDFRFKLFYVQGTEPEFHQAPAPTYLSYMIDSAIYTHCYWYNDAPAAMTRYDDLDVFYIDLAQSRTIEELRIFGGQHAEADTSETFSVYASINGTDYWLLLDQRGAKETAFVSYTKDMFEGSATARYLKFQCNQSSNWFTSGDKRVFFGFHGIQVWVLDEIIGEAILGESAAVLAGDPSFNTQADQALMVQIGDRVYTTPEVDEAANDQDTCDSLALRLLNEKYREFLPLEVDGVRSDIQLRQTVTVTITELGITAQDYFVQALSYAPGGKVSARLVQYRI